MTDLFILSAYIEELPQNKKDRQQNFILRKIINYICFLEIFVLLVVEKQLITCWQNLS